MSKYLPPSFRLLVRFLSAKLGDVLPLGWLWEQINPEQLSSNSLLNTSLGSTTQPAQPPALTSKQDLTLFALDTPRTMNFSLTSISSSYKGRMNFTRSRALAIFGPSGFVLL